MKLKTIEKDGVTYAEVQDGKPVYESEDGKSIAFDAPGTVATITRLNSEAKSNRLRAEAAEEAAKAFEGITDPAAARKAMETIANLDAKTLIDAGEVEKVKAEITKAFTEKLTTAEKRAADLEGALYGEKIGGAFARSKFISEKSAVPSDLIQARFGQNFRIEDGKVAAYDQSGNKVYSKSRPGEAADFEEALEILVDAYPHRDNILKGNSNGGSGAQQGGGGGGAKTITRAAFEKMTPAAQKAAVTTDGMTVTD